MEQTREAISETSSDNPQPRKRGRPAVYSEQLMNLARQYSDASTVRGKQNFLYMTRALSVLAYEPEFYWLVGTREEINAGKRVLRNTILTELGRIDDDDDLRAIARQICATTPRCKAAVAMIRRWRTGKAPAGDATSLTKAIIQTVNDYCAAHPDTTLQMVLVALEKAAEAFHEPRSPHYTIFYSPSNPSFNLAASLSPAPPVSPSSKIAGS